VRRYLRGLPVTPRKDFQKVYRAALPEAIDLLNQMLVFDPAKRITVQKAIEHPCLSAVRNKAAEAVAPHDLFPARADHDLSLRQLRQALISELDAFARERVHPVPPPDKQ
jgi:mitogen-activated protein kinase 6